MDYNDLANYSTAAEINNSMSTKAKKTNSLSLKVSDFNTYSDTIKNQMSSKANNSDSADYYTKTEQYITIHAEENGSLIKHALQWSFGNGTETNKQYGWPSPVDGKIIRASICACAGNQRTAEVKVWLVLNGNDRGDIEIVKPANVWSNHTIFSNPVTIKAGGRINFRSRTTDATVTHAMINILIEIDI